MVAGPPRSEVEGAEVLVPAGGAGDGATAEPVTAPIGAAATGAAVVVAAGALVMVRRKRRGGAAG